MNESNNNYAQIEAEFKGESREPELNLNEYPENINMNTEQFTKINNNQANSTLAKESEVNISSQITKEFTGKKKKRPRNQKSDKQLKNTSIKFKVTRFPNCFCETSEDTSLKKTSEKKAIKKRDNLVKATLKSPYSSFVKFIKIYGGIEESLKRVNLKNLFGDTENNQKSLQLSLRKIICFGEGNNNILVNKAKPKNKIYFENILDSKYLDLITNYYNNNKFFDFGNRKVHIEEFITFEDFKKEEEKKKKKRKKKKEKKKYYEKQEFDKIKIIVLSNFDPEKWKGRKGTKRKKKPKFLVKREETKEKGNISDGVHYANGCETEKQEESSQKSLQNSSSNNLNSIGNINNQENALYPDENEGNDTGQNNRLFGESDGIEESDGSVGLECSEMNSVSLTEWVVYHDDLPILKEIMK